jgi:hypothetical protein
MLLAIGLVRKHAYLSIWWGTNPFPDLFDHGKLICRTAAVLTKEHAYWLTVYKPHRRMLYNPQLA